MTTTENSSDTAVDPRVFDGPEYQRDPFPIYQRLRDHHPLYHDRLHNRWIVSRYDDIVAIFQDNESYDRATYKPDGPYEFGTKSVFGPNILEYGNGPRHRWMRNIVAEQFVGNRLQTFIPMIEKIAREQIERCAEKAAQDLAQGLTKTGEVELTTQFSSQLPVRVISNMLGLPREDEEAFVEWYDALIIGQGFGRDQATRGLEARNEMWDYLEPLILERRENPGDDLVSRIVHAELDGERMSMPQIQGFITLLLAAGGDTTDKAISCMWYHMLYTRPDQFEDVQRDPELWDSVFTEMMRYDPGQHGQARRTTREIVLHGDVIPERGNVALFLGAGNRDERVFKDPDTFDIHRDDLHMGREMRSGRYGDGKAGHLGFGMGQHFCMGYAMARQEAVIASKRLLEVMRNPRPKFATHPGITSPNIGAGGHRSLAELWIEFDIA